MRDWYRISRTLVRLAWVKPLSYMYFVVSFCWAVLLSPLAMIAPTWYWRLEGLLFMGQMIKLSHWMQLAGYRVHLSGDDLWKIKDDHSVVIMNHQYSMDTNVCFVVMQYFGLLLTRVNLFCGQGIRFKQYGRILWLHGVLFLKHGKQYRDKQVAEIKEYFINKFWPRGHRWIMFHPEAGLLKDFKERNQKYAVENGLSVWNYVMLPRVGALKAALDVAHPRTSAMSGISPPFKWLLDFTIFYTKALEVPDIFTGWQEPCDVYVHVRKFLVKDIPLEEGSLKAWMYARFEEKERMLERFHEGCQASPTTKGCRKEVDNGGFTDEILRQKRSQETGGDVTPGTLPAKPERIPVSFTTIMTFHTFFLSSFLAFVSCFYYIITSVC